MHHLPWKIHSIGKIFNFLWTFLNRILIHMYIGVFVVFLRFYSHSGIYIHMNGLHVFYEVADTFLDTCEGILSSCDDDNRVILSNWIKFSRTEYVNRRIMEMSIWLALCTFAIFIANENIWLWWRAWIGVVGMPWQFQDERTGMHV